jgi:hypothetical protein
MPTIKTVQVIRKDHPEGFCVINECDMQEGDQLYPPKPKTKPKAVAKKPMAKKVK